MAGSRILTPDEITRAVEELTFAVSVDLADDVEGALLRAAEIESGPLARYALAMLAENARVARREGLPLCQDTGMFHLFVDLGEGTAVAHGFRSAADEGLRRASAGIPLRPSIADDPLEKRGNRGDSTPVVVHLGEGGPPGGARLSLMAKGGGSENATHLYMLLPGEGAGGVRRVVLEAVNAKGAQACPPIIVGVGVGSDAAGAIEMALKSLLRPLGSRHHRAVIAELEEDMLGAINASGIGAAGLGGDITALDVHVEEAPSHIASLPVGVVICCHALRRRSLEV